jgi:hypothetical protein
MNTELRDELLRRREKDQAARHARDLAAIDWIHVWGYPATFNLADVAVRSNAKTLVTGTPIAALRRRLKYASVFQDQLLLESGVLRMEAGEGGSFSSAVPVTADQPARWQTPRQRQLAQQSPFQISIGRELTPGVPAQSMHPVVSSDSAISWTATLSRSPPSCRAALAGSTSGNSLSQGLTSSASPGNGRGLMSATRTWSR